ncbi:MAG: DUF2309 domain-containing protein, partial [Magnetospirillum sp. WYHS-4]
MDRSSLHDRLRHAIHHLEHVLPGQASIRDFVHHNTLHGFQHLPFSEALAEAHRVNGIFGFLPQAEYRAFFRQGRITRGGLEEVLSEDADLEAGRPVGPLRRLDVYRTALLHDFKPLTACQLAWQMDEMGALETWQPDLPEDLRRGGPKAVAALWEACLAALGLEHEPSHAEDLVDLAPERAERLLAGLSSIEVEAEQLRTHHLIRHEADRLLAALEGKVGREITLRGLLFRLTGRDILDEMRPYLLRHLASFLDEGLAAWNLPGRDRGFYAAWRHNARTDAGPRLEDFPDWKEAVDDLPDEPLAAILEELTLLGLPEDRWDAYLERLALELPGWSGMMMWRSLRPGYRKLAPERVEMMDYLAVRLVLERFFAQRLCRAEFRVEPRLDMFRWHFRRRRPELLVRWSLFNGRLPEYLASQAQGLLRRSREDPADDEDWQGLAHRIWTWRLSPAAEKSVGHGVSGSGWRLFRLTQHLGLSAADVAAGGRDLAEELLACLDRLTPERAGHLWLLAYERHYRDHVLGALAANRGRGRWARRDERPAAQAVFCMDDREEGIRRHLEERNPDVETLGAAGFFGVPINWRGLDDEEVSALCPVVVTPSHEIREEPRTGQDALHDAHAKRRARRLRLGDLVFRGSHRGLLSPALVAAAAAPG